MNLINRIKSIFKKPSASLRKLDSEEAASLEDCLGQGGILFDSQEEAEAYYFKKRDDDLARIEEIGRRFDLNLDYRAQSLKRLEGFYFRIYADRKIPEEMPIREFESLMTQYNRQVFVHLEMAEWQVVLNEFAPDDRYLCGLLLGYGTWTQQSFAEFLIHKENNKQRDYLYREFMMYIPEEREAEVQ